MAVSISRYGSVHLSGEDIDADLVLAFVRLLDGVGRLYAHWDRSFPERAVLTWYWQTANEDCLEWRARVGQVVLRSDIEGFS